MAAVALVPDQPGGADPAEAGPQDLVGSARSAGRPSAASARRASSAATASSMAASASASSAPEARHLGRQCGDPRLVGGQGRVEGVLLLHQPSSSSSNSAWRSARWWTSASMAWRSSGGDAPGQHPLLDGRGAGWPARRSGPRAPAGGRPGRRPGLRQAGRPPRSAARAGLHRPERALASGSVASAVELVDGGVVVLDLAVSVLERSRVPSRRPRRLLGDRPSPLTPHRRLRADTQGPRQGPVGQPGGLLPGEPGHLLALARRGCRVGVGRRPAGSGGRGGGGPGPPRGRRRGRARARRRDGARSGRSPPRTPGRRPAGDSPGSMCPPGWSHRFRRRCRCRSDAPRAPTTIPEAVTWVGSGHSGRRGDRGGRGRPRRRPARPAHGRPPDGAGPAPPGAARPRPHPPSPPSDPSLPGQSSRPSAERTSSSRRRSSATSSRRASSSPPTGPTGPTGGVAAVGAGAGGSAPGSSAPRRWA